MRNFWAIALVCSLASCDFMESKDKKARELVNQEMRSIDWNEVDHYPLFENCDESDPKEVQRACFENEVVSHFSITLREFEFVLGKDVDTTVYVDFAIDREGTISVLNIEKDPKINEQMPEFDGIVTQSLRALPPVSPALKRGIPVRAKFRIPIILYAN